MLSFILRRLLTLPLVMLGVTVLVVLLMQLIPPEQRAAAFVKNPQQLQQLDRIVRENGLDQPIVVQYWRWLSGVMQGNLGYSKASGQSVLQTIADRFPATLELMLFALFPIVGFGIWLGTRAALNLNKPIDHFAQGFAVLTWNLPSFILGVWLLTLFYGSLGWAPGFGQVSSEYNIVLLTGSLRRYTGLLTLDAALNGNWGLLLDALWHLLLPVLTLATLACGTFVQVMRGSLLETLPLEFVRTAKAKGLSDKNVFLYHARRNALIPIITLAGGTAVSLLNGSVIVETIFAYPGIGAWGANSASTLDYAGVLGFALFVAFLVVLGNLLTDILYGICDPRVRFD
jgi:ABC-type dipeptide/oligopeptide/nickel transport system permease component